MQQALFPTGSSTDTLPLPLPPDTTSDQLLGSNDLQRLGDRLRVTYGPVETPLPARLAELVERLARREQGRD
jgi:hypothetical protein